MVQALIVGFDNNNVPFKVASHALWLAQVGLGHLPGKYKLSLRRKLLNTPGHIDHIHVVLPINRHRARLVELGDAHATRADNLHMAEELALKRVL